MNKQYLFETMDTRQEAPVQDLVEAHNLKSADRQKANGAIAGAVKGYFKSPDAAMLGIETVLQKYGIRRIMLTSSDFLSDTGTKRFPVSRDGKDLDNTLLIVSWSKAGDRGNYDVTAYLS